MELYIYVHTSCKRALPNQMIDYKHAFLLHKLYNDESMSKDWLDLSCCQNFNQRHTFIKFFNTLQYKSGKNLLCNRFILLNWKIELSWLNLPYNICKIKCKQFLLYTENVNWFHYCKTQIEAIIIITTVSCKSKPKC